MTTFPDEKVRSRLRYLSVDVDIRAFHTDKSVNLRYLFKEENVSLVSGEMKELRSVAMRIIIVREKQ
jgi:hypothetical protein